MALEVWEELQRKEQLALKSVLFFFLCLCFVFLCSEKCFVFVFLLTRKPLIIQYQNDVKRYRCENPFKNENRKIFRHSEIPSRRVTQKSHTGYAPLFENAAQVLVRHSPAFKRTSFTLRDVRSLAAGTTFL